MKAGYQLILALGMLSPLLQANESSPEHTIVEPTTRCDQSKNVDFTTNNIFDLSDEDTIFLHHWANFLHIKTKENTLHNESAFFLEKCEISDADLRELERHLRKKRFIRDASVTRSDNDRIKVETWDNWSLTPIVDFGRKGGKNKFSFGLQDRNLLGLGINAELEYFSNNQRTGYRFETHFPLYLRRNMEAKLRISDNDDGNSQAFFVEKKFVSFDTESAFKIGFDNFKQIDTQYENGRDSNKYKHKKNFATAQWKWLHHDSLKETLRFGVGYTQEKHRFFKLDDQAATIDLVDSILPDDREFNYPFVSFEYLQKDYRKLTNLYLINHFEDFNLGWSASSSIGTDLSGNSGSPLLLWQSRLSKGVNVFNNSYWFFDLTFEGETYDERDQETRLRANVKTEYFHKFNSLWGGYFKNENQFSQNQFADAPLVLGGETGVRGYPLQYKHGEHSTQFTVEARYYPQYSIYKLLEVGGAAFIDTGRVFNPTPLSKTQSTWMTSVGIGARFYSTRASDAQVIHLDLIKPISSDPNVNNFEIRATTRQSF